MPVEATYPFRQANKYHQGRADYIDLIVVHCTAGPESSKGTGAEGVQAMFAHNTRDASAHVTVDQNSKARSVHDWDTAWSCKGFNANGLHLELVGMPTQSESQWLDGISKATLLQGADVISYWARRYGIPTGRFLNIDELRGARPRGLTTHADCERAKPSSGHTDPGPHFPRAVFLDMIRKDIAGAGGVPKAAGPNPYLRWATPCGPGWGSKDRPSNEVKFCQWACGIPVDGIFGDHTEAIVNAVKKRLGLQPNGVCDWAMIEHVKGIKR